MKSPALGLSTPALGYGTYGMKGEDPFVAIPRLAKIGYTALELAVAPGWPTAPDRLDGSARRTLASVIEEVGMTPPALLDLLNPFAPDSTPETLAARLHDVFQLANDLNFSTAAPIFTATLGNHLPEWETGREQIAAKVQGMAEIAREHGVILAIEPHVGGAFDRPEKAEWLMKTLNHPNARLNVDVSHFLAQDLDIGSALERLVPYACYAHIKDVAEPAVPPQFLLPGQGAFDLTWFFQKLNQLGYEGNVVVEVSGMIWNRPDYDSWEAAEFCYRALQTASTHSSPAASI